MGGVNWGVGGGCPPAQPGPWRPGGLGPHASENPGTKIRVDPDFKILGASYPYFARRLMEDTDPQLRRSLKEMLFEGEAFKWSKLEDLIENATKQTQLDLEKAIEKAKRRIKREQKKNEKEKQ